MSLAPIISKSKLLNSFYLTVFLCLFIVAIYFSSGVFEQFASKKSSFSQYFEPIEARPTIIICPDKEISPDISVMSLNKNFWYGQDFQGTGLNKNCKFLLLQFAFEHMKVQRVEFRADNKNKRSIAAMKSIGCSEEGILRSNCAAPNGRRDSIILSILRYEWFSRVKRELLKKL